MEIFLLCCAIRLLKNREADAAAANASIILSDPSYIELLLDLLEHEDLSVGVMASQIMTEIHSQDGAALESQIQQCPDGSFTFQIKSFIADAI